MMRQECVRVTATGDVNSSCAGSNADDGGLTSYECLAFKEHQSDVLPLTVKELNELSLEDREKVFEEVNGISSTIKEDPIFVDKCLLALDTELEQIVLGRLAYVLAISKRPQLRNNRQFCLMFLRSERFHPAKAAKRLVTYFDSKRFLFGEDKLVKHITYNDLDEDDQKALQSGSF